MSPHESGSLLKIPFRSVAYITLSLPLISLVFCVFLSLLYDFERAVATHCNVDNYLPSLSASIGGFTPQRYIWKAGVAFHSAPRIFVALMYFNYFKSFSELSTNGLLKRLVKYGCVSNILELFSLVSLTYVTSTENYRVHEVAFITFVVFSILYMLITLYLFTVLRSGRPHDREISTSFRAKRNCFVAYVSCLTISLYFFYRHNTYCEPYVYTLFALCEYLVVLSNMAFHGTVYYDFRDYELAAVPMQDVVYKRLKEEDTDA